MPLVEVCIECGEESNMRCGSRGFKLCYDCIELDQHYNDETSMKNNYPEGRYLKERFTKK